MESRININSNWWYIHWFEDIINLINGCSNSTKILKISVLKLECRWPEESNNSVIDILDLSQGAHFSHGGVDVYMYCPNLFSSKLVEYYFSLLRNSHWIHRQRYHLSCTSPLTERVNLWIMNTLIKPYIK